MYWLMVPRHLWSEPLAQLVDAVQATVRARTIASMVRVERYGGSFVLSFDVPERALGASTSGTQGARPP
jgi:hypothetical protein